jgi:2-dehydro-3-deoxygluconokinase
MKVLIFGEIMLRLKAPDTERLFQTPFLEATFGGGEANVAVGLARLGMDVAFVTVIPRNPIGDACVDELRKHGVDTSRILRAGHRLGVYFLEPGANQRSSVVVYDRAHSAIAEAEERSFDWDAVFEDAGWFHVSGITPAISRNASLLALQAVRAAHSRGVTVSCDLNYRKKLWNYGKEPAEVMQEIAGNADILVGNEEDYQKSLNITVESDVESGKLDLSEYEKMTRLVLEKYPGVRKVAVTLRESHSADYNGWSAALNNRERFSVSRKYEIRDIVDRVGAGDTFVAGLIFGLLSLPDDWSALEFAAAASCLMHSIPGDLPLIRREEVERLAGGAVSGRVQR